MTNQLKSRKNQIFKEQHQTTRYWVLESTAKFPTDVGKVSAHSNQPVEIFRMRNLAFRRKKLFINNPGYGFFDTEQPGWDLGLTTIFAIRLEADYFICLDHDFPPILVSRDSDRSALSIVKLNKEAAVLEILSPQAFIEVVEAIQNMIRIFSDWQLQMLKDRSLIDLSMAFDGFDHLLLKEPTSPIQIYCQIGLPPNPLDDKLKSNDDAVIYEPPVVLNNVESSLIPAERTNLDSGKFLAKIVSRRLPSPLDTLNTGQQIAIFEKSFISNEVLLIMRHPLLNPTEHFDYGLKPIRAVEQDGEYFIHLTNQNGQIDNPPFHDKEYPPPTIVKFDSKTDVLEILSPEKFREIVAVMQKNINAGGSSSTEDRIKELDFAFNLLIGKNSLDAAYSEQDYEPDQVVYGPPNFWDKPFDNNSDDNGLLTMTVYGPPPMYLDEKSTELPITLRDLKIDKDIIPPTPLELSKLFNNKIVWMIVGIVVGFSIAVVAIALFIILFLRFR